MFGSNGLSAADVAAVVRNNDGCCNNGGYGMMNGIGGYGFVRARSLLILWQILSAAISRFPIRTLTAAPASAAVNSKWFRKGV